VSTFNNKKAALLQRNRTMPQVFRFKYGVKALMDLLSVALQENHTFPNYTL